MIMSPLDLRHLSTLQALAETGSLTRAALRVHLTQSALSRQIAVLEDHYGQRLFERTQPAVRFTPAGQRLLDLAAEVLPRVRDAERALAQLREGQSGSLRIAVECHSCFDWLMPAMDALRPRWPEVEMDLLSGFLADPLQPVLDGRADLAVLHEAPPPSAAFAVLPLFSFDFVALLARDHPLAAQSALQAADFAAETLITYPVPDDKLDVMRQLLIPAGVRPAARRSAELTAAIVQLVASKRGIAVLPRWAALPYLERGYVVGRPLGAPPLRGELFAAMPAELAHRAYLREFVELVRGSEQAREAQG
ncbi:MAG: LysR family transcriptional regulator [Thiomonas sp.]